MMMSRAAMIVGAQRQRGAALMVAMLIIFMLALMGGSAMRSATLERVLITNAIQARDVFQAAESSTESALNDSQNLINAFNSGTGSVLIETTIRSDIELDSQVTLRFISESNATGASLNAMQGARSFDALHFVAEGVAKIDAVGANRRIDQGAMRIVPAN